MKSQNRKILTLLLLLLMQFVWVKEVEAVFDLSDYAYYKEIQGFNDSGTVAVDLDEDIYINSNFADLKILDDAGGEIPVKLYQKDLKNITKAVKIVNQEEGMEKLLDKNKETVFTIKEGEIDPAWKMRKSSLVFDLGEEQDLRIVDFINDIFEESCLRMDVFTSIDGENYEFVKSVSAEKKTMTHVLNFDDLTTRFLKIDFGYANIIPISEIVFYVRENSKLVFEYEASKTYQLYYGNIQANKEIQKVNFTVVDLPILSLGEQRENLDYNMDIDGDGVDNFKDNCPLEKNADQKDTDGDTMGDVCDSTKFMQNHDELDFDMDGIGNSSDNCVFIKNIDQLDFDEDGLGDLCEDDDGDMVLSFEDNCIEIFNQDQNDENGNGIGDFCEGDNDNDGVDDVFDNCREALNTAQLDFDEDGVGDACDNCKEIPNVRQVDSNGDGVGDVCEDTDGDGFLDSRDNCKKIVNVNQNDFDADGVGDVCDNCLNVKNSSQWDDDGDGVGNECDDDDGDGVLAGEDNCPNHANADQKDSNNDGVGDVCEDFDGDTIIDLADNCVTVANVDQEDSDGNGVGDACDFKIVMKKSNYWFYGILVVVGMGIVYYGVQLVRQLREKKNRSLE